MCGIVGYIGSKKSAPLLLKGLRNLEYRGYDSVGIACLNGKGLEIRKDVGKIDEAHKKLRLDEPDGTVGIGHTRWATHGGVTKINAHPHLSCQGTLAVIHNGIIENFAELRESLEKHGHKFVSETDTEVLAHMFEETGKKQTLEKAVMDGLKMVKGSYGIAVVSSKEPNKIVVARKDSPLVVGVGKGEYFLSSDFLPFLEHTKEFLIMEDEEVGVLTRESAKFYTLEGKEVKKKTNKVAWNPEEASKGGYPHYLIKEIHEQPAAIRNALRQDRRKLEQVAHMIHASPRVAIVAAGTSRHASLVGRYVISELSGKYCEVYMASEFQYFVDKIGKDALIIAVSQSGETADVLIPVKMARKNGCKVVAITNVAGSSIDREADVSLFLNCGPEISVAATKTFTSQLAIFYQLAYTLAYKYEEGMKLLEQIPEKIEETIKLGEPIVKKLAPKLAKKNDFYYIARGENFAVATEGALKLKEVSYIHAEGMPAGELKHGTIALLEKGTPVVAILPRDHTFEEALSNVSEARARGGFIIAISDENHRLFDAWLPIPKFNHIFYPLLAVVHCQLLAYYLGVARGTDVDKPRNLAKSVTVK